jgi:hypothetical protein
LVTLTHALSNPNIPLAGCQNRTSNRTHLRDRECHFGHKPSPHDQGAAGVLEKDGLNALLRPQRRSFTCVCELGTGAAKEIWKRREVLRLVQCARRKKYLWSRRHDRGLRGTVSVAPSMHGAFWPPGEQETITAHRSFCRWHSHTMVGSAARPQRRRTRCRSPRRRAAIAKP